MKQIYFLLPRIEWGLTSESAAKRNQLNHHGLCFLHLGTPSSRSQTDTVSQFAEQIVVMQIGQKTMYVRVGVNSVSSRFKDLLMQRLSHGVTFIVPFLYLQGVLHWKIQLLRSWSQSCEQVTSDQVWGTLETNLPRGPDTNILSAHVDLSSICCFSCRWWWKKWSCKMFGYLIPEGCKISILLLWDSKIHLFIGFMVVTLHTSLSLPALSTSSQPLRLQSWALWSIGRGGMWSGWW